MKIGIFSDSWVPNLNGVVISIINEVQTLRNNHDFAIFVPKLKQAIPFEIEGVPIYELPSVPFPGYPGYSVAFPPPKLNKILKKERFDFIHNHTPFSLGYFATLSAKVFYDLPLLSHYHTHLVEYSGHLIPFGELFADKITAILEHAVWFYTRMFYRFSDVIVTPSKTLQYDLVRHGVKEPVYSLPNMISEVFLRKTRNTSEDLDLQDKMREDYGIKSSSRIIMYCGRVSHEKKLEILFNAFKKIQNEFPDAFLLIVGDGPQLEKYRKVVADLNIQNFAFTGFISHTKLPAIYRTQGLTVLEAMSQGIPVIGVARGGVMDYIAHQKNGLLTPPGNSDAFAASMVTLLSEPDTYKKYALTATKTVEMYSSAGYDLLLEKAIKITCDLFAESK
ncbi:MAG: glycosyltransferase [Candidatus Hodarchaeales archaeon]